MASLMLLHPSIITVGYRIDRPDRTPAGSAHTSTHTQPYANTITQATSPWTSGNATSTVRARAFILSLAFPLCVSARLAACGCCVMVRGWCVVVSRVYLTHPPPKTHRPLLQVRAHPRHRHQAPLAVRVASTVCMSYPARTQGTGPVQKTATQHHTQPPTHSTHIIYTYT